MQELEKVTGHIRACLFISPQPETSLGWPTRAFTHDEYLWKDLYGLVHTGKVPRQSRNFIPHEVSISQFFLSWDDLPLTSSPCGTWWDPSKCQNRAESHSTADACYRTAYLIWGKYTHVDKQRLGSLCCTKYKQEKMRDILIYHKPINGLSSYW